MEAHYQLTDSEFEQAFEQGTLEPGLFSHQAHIRLAWIHLKKYGPELAIENISQQLASFTKRVGAADKFHLTLTVAAIKAVQYFRSQSQSEQFSDFMAEFPRLQHQFKDLMAAHYSAERLSRADAKNKYLAPDLLAFP